MANNLAVPRRRDGTDPRRRLQRRQHRRDHPHRATTTLPPLGTNPDKTTTTDGSATSGVSTGPTASTPTSSGPAPTSTLTTTASPTSTDPATGAAATRQQVERDFLAAERELSKIASDPKGAGNIARRLRRVMVPDSDIYRAQLDIFVEMRRTGQSIVFGEPKVLRNEVESIEFVGSEPIGTAIVTVCNVDNAARAAVDETGGTVFVIQSPEIRAYRKVYEMRRDQSDTWRQALRRPILETEIWVGKDQCR
ncbi:MAG: hypothetical protein H0U28_15115 [Nocardioidaceae bacterium]|nr:hypothetical protein [Nocardioidaceae bacterium]